MVSLPDKVFQHVAPLVVPLPPQASNTASVVKINFVFCMVWPVLNLDLTLKINYQKLEISIFVSDFLFLVCLVLNVWYSWNLCNSTVYTSWTKPFHTAEATCPASVVFLFWVWRCWYDFYALFMLMFSILKCCNFPRVKKKTLDEYLCPEVPSGLCSVRVGTPLKQHSNHHGLRKDWMKPRPLEIM